MNTHFSLVLRSLLVALVITLAVPPLLFASTAEHIVQPGETLLQIAIDYDVTVSALLRANDMYNANFVRVGQTLIIPSVGSDSSGIEDSFAEVSNVDSVPVAETEQVDQVSSIERPDPEELDSTEEDVAPSPYITVQPGDTLSQIALHYGMSSSALMALNGLSNPNIVQVGQQIRVARDDEAVTSMDDMLPTWDTGQIHVVTPGESLGEIAELYGVKISILMSFNNMQGVSTVHVGQKLRIPEMPNLDLEDVDYTNAPPPGQRLLEVDLTGQWLTAWDGDKVFMHTLISSGMPDTPTVLGRYAIYSKYEKQDMNGFNGPLPDVPWIMYFYEGFAFHGAYWHNSFGIPMSHGCVHLTPELSKKLYDWADIGTPVYVHW